MMKSWADQLPFAGDTKKRAVFLALVALILFASGVVIFSLLSPSYVTLMSDLQPADAQEIVDSLASEGVDYKLDAGGSAILVSKGDFGKAKMRLASQGLPGYGHVGLEIFSETDYGQSSFSQQVNYKRAMQGELARTIMTLPEVLNARVHLVLPEKSLFKSKEVPPSASIVVIEKHNMRLTKNQVGAIQNMIAASVKGMTADSVVVINDNGERLSVNLRGEDAEKESTNGVVAEMEKAIELKVEKVVSRFLSSSDFAVSATVDISDNNYTVKKEQPLAGDEDKVLASHVTESKKDRSGQGKDFIGEKTETKEKAEYAVGKLVEERTVNEYEVKRISIAVVMPRDTDQSIVDDVTRLSFHAAGMDKDRGDTIHVAISPAFVEKKENAPVRTAGTVPPEESSEAYLRWQILAVTGVLLLVIALVRVRKATLSHQERARLAEEIESWLVQTRKERPNE